MSETVEGGCACGAVRYRATIEKREGYFCHCRMCQRASGSLSLALTGVKKTAHQWLSSPAWYDSSAIARRPFCPKCGTSLGFEYRENSDSLDITIASLDDPASFKPIAHFGAESMHEDWIDTGHLRRDKASEYQPLVDRWKEAETKS